MTPTALVLAVLYLILASADSGDYRPWTYKMSSRALRVL